MFSISEDTFLETVGVRESGSLLAFVGLYSWRVWGRCGALLSFKPRASEASEPFPDWQTEAQNSASLNSLSFSV